MKRVIIEYVRFYDREGKEKTVGGIQTYISNLAALLANNLYEVIIVQPSNKEFLINENGYSVKGIPCPTKNFSKISKELIKAIEDNYDFNNDILIFASSVLVRKTKFKKTINIQHGIYWDIPFIKGVRNLPDVLTIALRAIKSLEELKAVNNSLKTICVDYNYINWYRCQTLKRNKELVAIPNFVDTDQETICKKENDNIVSIIFARRFEEIRGSRLIINVFKEILNKYENVNITMAGTGADEELLKSNFEIYKERVKFIKYAAEDSINLHAKYDIAVVPSIGSEGTSLSLLEAMWAQCAVICTNVGGMTNIILDGYNGRMISPTHKELVNVLNELIIDKEKREYLSKNAKETVKHSFSKQIWDKKWMNVINNL